MLTYVFNRREGGGSLIVGKSRDIGQCLLTFFAALLLFAPAGWSQGSAFTYQGRLTDANQPANGQYDFTFQLLDASTNGNVIGASVRQSPIAATNGVFTTSLDFGNAPFMGRPLWLEIGVRTNGSLSAYKILAPRQPLTPTPYAIFASTAGIATNLASGARIFGDGAGITNLSGLNIVPGTITSNQMSQATDAAYRAGASLALEYSTPQQFGAKGDGVTDDTAALQSWLADASVHQKVALLPPAPGGFYKITSELSVSNGLYLSGAGGGKHATSGFYTTTSQIRQFTPGQNGLHLYNAVDSIRIDDVAISTDFAYDYTNHGVGIYFDGGAGDSDCSILKQCLVMGFGTGLNLASAANTSITGCSFGWNGTGVSISGVANNITLESCQLSYNYGHQVYSLAADNLIIKGCDVAAETPASQGVYVQNNSSLIMLGCRFEDYSTNVMLIATTTSPQWGPTLTLVGTRFYNFSGAYRYSVATTNTLSSTFLNCFFEAQGTDGYSLVASGLDMRIRVYAVPAQIYFLTSGSNAKSLTATMVDPSVIAAQIGSNIKSADQPLTSSQALPVVTKNPREQMSSPTAAPLALPTAETHHSAGFANLAGVTTNLMLPGGTQLCISNGIIVQIK